MIRRAEPVRFDRLAEAGRNQPLLITVETSDGEEHDAYLKASGRPEVSIEGLANELLAAYVGADLGLPIPEPFLVNLDPAWVDSIPHPPTKSMLKASAPLAFASKSVGRQWKVWSAGDVLTATRAEVAVEVLAFDAFIENQDRRPDNPNCLVKGDQLRIIDHELAFRIRQKLWPKPEPWVPGRLFDLTRPSGHLFGAALKERGVDLERAWRTWSHLNDRRIVEYSSLVPSEWDAARDAIGAAVKHLRTVRERIDECIEELQRALT